MTSLTGDIAEALHLAPSLLGLPSGFHFSFVRIGGEASVWAKGKVVKVVKVLGGTLGEIA